MSKKAISFLCKTPHQNTINFAGELYEKCGIEVVIVCDSYPDLLQFKLPKGVAVQYVPDHVCEERGYMNSNISATSTHIPKNPIAWDKFCYLFCEVHTYYDFVWVFEEDCFIPNVEALKVLDYVYNSYDLVCANNFYNDGSAQDWHWKSIYKYLKAPYYQSMVCASGMSRKLLDCVKKFKEENNTLLHIEAMFNTLAMQNNLNVICPFELLSVVWLGDWGLDEMVQIPTNIFHPVKNIDDHPAMRERLVKALESGYEPKEQKLPSFITDLM